jgi:type II secretory pathway pseudopilin PulG
LKTQKTKNKKINKGSSLVEALISIAIISFVVVSILSGFSQQQADTKRNTDKNMAVMLAEMKMEELLKFPSDRLAIESFVDYVVLKPNGFEVIPEGSTAPTELRQFRRTVNIEKTDVMQQLATITVTVDFGATRGTGTGSGMLYPYSVQLTTRRSLK